MFSYISQICNTFLTPRFVFVVFKDVFVCAKSIIRYLFVFSLALLSLSMLCMVCEWGLLLLRCYKQVGVANENKSLVLVLSMLCLCYN